MQKPEADVIIRTMRPSFLLLTVSCVLLGAGTAAWNDKALDATLLILVLTGALSAHISVNMLNEYADFTSGLDFNTQKTPFSGGSGALPASPDMAPLVKWIGLAAAMLIIVIGVYFLQLYGLGLMPIGLLGLVLVLSYSPWINRHPMACLLAPGTGFGLLMVIGTDYALSGAYHLLPWLTGLVPFFLVNNLLLLNQYPDSEADAQVGRRHLPISAGTRTSTLVYAIFSTSAFGTILIGVSFGLLPLLALIALLPLPMAILAWHGARLHGYSLGQHPSFLAANVGVSIATPALLGLTLLLA